MSEATGTISNRIEGIEWRRLITAFVIALVPAFGAYMVVSVGANDPLLWVFPLSIVAFTYSLYGHEMIKGQVGAGLFWLAIEAFAAPIAILAFTVVYTSEQTGAFAQAGAALGGTVIFLITWFLSWTVGVVLYLVSRRFER